MTVGQRIKETRESLGLSQDDLALKMGYSGRSSVCKAETYGDNITTSKVQKFADALGVSFSYLMGWEDKASLGTYGIGKSNVLFERINRLDEDRIKLLTAYLELLEKKQ